jgi:cold shock CspA family protein
MDTLIGTVGFFDSNLGRGFIHPDYNYQSAAGLNLAITPESLQASTVEKLTSGDRVTCVVAQGQDGAHASDIKQYEGQGI